MYIAIITLSASIIGLVVLIGFKAIENRFGRLFLDQARTRAGDALDQRIASLKATMPHTASRVARLTVRIARAYASFGIAKALMGVERVLEGSLKRLRHAPRSLEQSGQASRFLREVAAYKRLLSQDESKPRVDEAETVKTEPVAKE